MLLPYLSVIGPIVAAIVAGVALWINHKAADKGEDREEFDSLVAAYKGLYEMAVVEVRELRAEVTQLKAEIRRLRQKVEDDRDAE